MKKAYVWLTNNRDCFLGLPSIGKVRVVFVGNLDELDPSVAHILALKLIHGSFSVTCRFKENDSLSGGAAILILANFDWVGQEFVIGEKGDNVLVLRGEGQTSQSQSHGVIGLDWNNSTQSKG